MKSKKPRADSKLKNLSRDQQGELFGLLSEPQGRGAKKKVLTLAEVQVEIPLRFGLTSSLGSISEFRAWYVQRERTENAAARAEQAKLEWLKSNPDTDPDDLERLGQMIFTSESVENGDIKAFVSLIKANNQKRKIKIDEKRMNYLIEKEKKAEQAKAQLESTIANAKKGGGLSPEALEAIEHAAQLL